jgi:hypothetical protein
MIMRLRLCRGPHAQGHRTEKPSGGTCLSHAITVPAIGGGALKAHRRTVCAHLTLPSLATITHSKTGDPESGDRIKPPPAKRGVGKDAHWHRRGADRA